MKNFLKKIILQTFSDAFFQVLKELASSDPDNQNCMKEQIDKIGWVNYF